MSRIAVRIAVFLVLAGATVPLSGRGFAAEAVRRDCYGDPLPKGAIARLGSLRFRYEGGATALQFSLDGKVADGKNFEWRPLCDESDTWRR